MKPKDNNLEQTYDGLAVDSSLESPIVEETPVTVSDKPRLNYLSPFRYNKTAFMVTGLTLAFIVLVGLGTLLFTGFHGGKQAAQSDAQKVANFAVSSLSLNGVTASQQLKVGEADHLAVNGQLRVSNTLVLTPGSQPGSPTAGQIYYDKSTNAPYYYNGSQFVSLAPTAVPQHVSALGGAAGVIGLGDGLTINGNQLAISSSVLQSVANAGLSGARVTSLQGLTGDVTLAAGPGIGISGTTISNNGVLSLVAGSGNLSVTNDGSGNYTVSESGGGTTVALGPASAQTDTSNNSSINVNKTGSGNLLELASNGVDSFVVNQAGQITTGTIDFSQVQGVPAIVNSIGGASGALSLGTGLSVTGTTLSNSGVTSLTGTANQLTVSAATGAVTLSLPQDIATTSTPTFGGLTLGAAGSTTGSLNLANNVNTNLVVVQGLNPSGSGNATIRIPSIAGGSSDTVCLLTLANCAGALTGSGTTNTITKFTGASSLGNSGITDDGTNVTIGGEGFIANTVTAATLQSSGTLNITPGGNLTVGATNHTFVLQGSGGSTIQVSSSGHTTTVGFVLPTAGRAINFPDESGTLCLQASTNCGFAIAGSGVITLNGLAGALTIADAGVSGSTITIQDASTSQKGIAQFNLSDFSASGGVVDTIQGIGTGAAVQFGSLGLGVASSGGNLTLASNHTVFTDNLTATTGGSGLTVSGGANNIMFSNQGGANTFLLPTTGGTGQVICTSGISCASGGGQAVILEPGGVQTASANQTAVFINKQSGSGNLLQLQAAGSNALVINNAGVTTITSGGVTNNFNVGGTLGVNTITPTGALTIGATGQAFTLQGTGGSTLTATGGGFLTSVGFNIGSGITAPTGNVLYQFQNDNTVAAGTYNICTTSGNCAGVGGSITGSGTAGTIAKFTAAGNIANSILTDNGTAVTVAGNLVVQGTTGLTVGTASALGQINLTDGTADGFTDTFSSTTLTGSHTITVPNGSGTLAVSASGPLSLDPVTGALSCASCLTSGGGGSGGVSSITGTHAGSAAINGALTINNALTSGSAITIDNASTSVKGIATFNSTNFQDNGSGTINTIQDIAIASSPTFTNLTLQGATGLVVGSSSNLGQIAFKDGTADGFTSLFSPATLGGNQTITIPNASGTLAVSVGGSNLSLSAQGQLSFSNSPTFSGTLAVQGSGGITVGVAGTTAGTINLANAGSTRLVVIQGLNPSGSGNATVQIPILPGGTTDTVCLATLSNCVGTGGSVSTSGGTQNFLTKYTNGAATQLGNSELFDNGSGVSVGNTSVTGLFNVGSSNQFQVSSAGAVTAVGINSSGISKFTGSGDSSTVAGSGVLIQNASNSTNAFEIQNAAGTGNLFVADTTNGIVGIGQAPTAGGGALQVTGNITASNTINANNAFQINTTSTSGGTLGKTAIVGTGGVTNHDVVVLNSSGQVVDTTTARDPRVYGVANNTVISGGGVNAVFSGNFIVNATGPISAGDQLVTSTTAGRVVADNSATTGILGYALSALASGNGTVNVELHPVNGQSTPIFSPQSDSTTAFQIQNAARSTTLFDADTTNTAIGVAGASTTAGYALNVTGSINASTNIFVNGVAVCTVTACAASAPGGYIVNGTTVQTGNFNIQSAAAGSIGAIIQAASGQTADLLEVKNTSGNAFTINSGGNVTVASGLSLATNSLNSTTSTLTVSAQGTIITNKAGSTTPVTLAVKGIGSQTGDLLDLQTSTPTTVVSVGATGAALFENSTDSTTAFQIQNHTGSSNLFVADTTDGKIGIGLAPTSSSSTLSVSGTSAATSGFVLNNTTTSSGNITKNSLAGTGGVSANNDVVVLNSSGQAVDTNTARDTRVYGVATTAATVGNPTGVVISGNFIVNATTNSGANPIHIGDQLVTSATSGDVMADNNATTGIVGTALTALASGTGTVNIAVRPVGGQSTPDFTPTTDSTTAFQIQNAARSTVLFDADTTNGLLGVGAAPTAGGSTLQVTGSISATTNLNIGTSGGGALTTLSQTALVINGVTVCTSAGCGATGGSGSYIQNGTVLQTANFNIQSTSAGSVTATIEGASGQTADLIDLKDGSGTIVHSTSATGNELVKPSTNSVTAFQVQNAAGTPVLTTDTTNSIVTVQGANSDATQGGQLITDGTFAGGTWTTTGWTVVSSQATHTSGNTNALSTTQITVAANTVYQIYACYSSNTTTGATITTSIGGVSGTAQVTPSGFPCGAQIITTGASPTNVLSFTPSSTWNGFISNLSVQVLTGSNSALTVLNSSGGAALEVRSNDGTQTTLIGLGAGQYIAAGGVGNTAIGAAALQNASASLTPAPSDDTAIGANALQNDSTTGQNTAVGYDALQSLSISNTINPGDVALGAFALQHTTTGPGNTALGTEALQNDTSGQNNVAVGYNSGAANTTGSNNIFIGYNSTANGGNLANSTAVGYASEVGQNNSLELGCVNGINGCGASTKVGVDNIAPTFTLDVAGDIRAKDTVLANGGAVISGLTVPTAPTVTQGGTAGGTSYTYAIAAVNANGGSTLISSTTTTATGNATLNGTNFNNINWTAVAGVFQYKIYRTASSGTPSTTGLIGTVAGSEGAVANTFKDTGIAATTAAPTVDTSGQLQANGTVLFQNTANSTTAFQLQNAAGTTTLLDADTSANQLTVGVHVAVTGGVGIVGLTTPSAPTVTNQGTAGATHYTYAVSAANAQGGSTLISATTQTTTGNATLNGTNFNQITWTGVPGAFSYNIWRTASSGTPSTTGLIGTGISTSALSFNDTGIAGSGVVPTVDNSGELLALGSALFKNATNSTTAFQIQNAAGTGLLTVNTTASTITTGAKLIAAAGTNSSTGAELMTGSESFPATTGWTGISGTGTSSTATHTAGGGLTPISPTPALTITSGNYYQVSFTVTGSPTAGESVTPSIGGSSGSPIYGNDAAEVQVLVAGGAGNLAFTPTNNWNGTISNISVKLITQANASVTVSGTPINGASALNLYIGTQTGVASAAGGGQNVGIGPFSMISVTTGQSDTALGYGTLSSATTSSNLTAIGESALWLDTTGQNNTALGFQAGVGSTGVNADITGSNNTFVGYNASFGSLAQLQNASAFGTYAVVSQNDSLVLGCVSGVNGCTANTKVGVDNASPGFALDVTGDINASGVLRVAGSQIASSNLSDSANLAKLNATQTFTSPNTFTGSGNGSTIVGTLLKNASNSTTAFEVQNAAGTSNLLVADTTHNLIGIGQTPVNGGGTLQVTGDVTLTAGDVVLANGNHLEAARNSGGVVFNLLGFDPGTDDVGMYLGNSTTGNEAFHITNAASKDVFSLSGYGQLLLQNEANSTNAFQVQNSGGAAEFDVDTSNGRVGIANATPGNLLSIGALTTAQSGYRVAVSTGGTSNSGIVVQDVASQSAGNLLQAEDSTGATLASIDYQGNLTVKAATINGNLTLNGHLLTANSSGTTTATKATSLGSTGTCTVAGDDTAGTITMVPGGSGIAGGDLCTITFGAAFGSTPHVVVGANNQNGAQSDPFADNAGTASFQVGAPAAPSSGQTYSLSYIVAQ